MAVAGEQPDPFILALDDKAIYVVLDLMDPVGAGGDLGASGRDAGLE